MHKHKVIMRFILRCMSIVVVVAIPLFALADGNSPEGKKDDVKSPWQDMKNVAKPIKPNIAKEYDDLVAVFAEYWNARKNGDHKKAYQLEGSAYRKTTNFDVYRHQHTEKPVEIISVRPLEVKQVNEKEVMVKASFGFKAGVLDTVHFIHDHWVKEDKGWRHLPEDEKKG